MILDEIGKISALFSEARSTHFDQTMVAEHAVMPNHVHLILALNIKQIIINNSELTRNEITRGVGPHHGVAPTQGVAPPHDIFPPHDVSPQHIVSPPPGLFLPPGVPQPANQFGKPIAGSVSVIINQYKASVKRWCNKHGREFFQWQSRFYDHIIRNKESFNNIINYMTNNPKQWEKDKFNQITPWKNPSNTSCSPLSVQW
ncbi:MAG: hypothetical protein M0P47_11925 [Bacteroidales bacterium]|nr:hypothetical protein [Bacteroidales bacterium]